MLAAAVNPDLHLHQLFVTANPILRTSVAKSFKSLQSGFLAAIHGSAMADASGARTTMAEVVMDEELPTLSAVKESSWPLFLRAHHWLRLLDGTLLDERGRVRRRLPHDHRREVWWP